jgi:hypothetical protein
MSVFDRLTTRHTFDDGAKASVLHRYALRLEVGDRTIDIGFEQALEPGVDRLIHGGSIQAWDTPAGGLPVAANERAEILARVIHYCEVKGLTYRVVQ